MKTYTDKSNAARAAKKAAAKAGCSDPKPGEDFAIKEVSPGKFGFTLSATWTAEAEAPKPGTPDEMTPPPAEPEAPAVDIAALTADADMAALTSTPAPGATPKAEKAPRLSKRDKLIAAARDGVKPEALLITSDANASYQTRANKLRDMGDAGDLDGLRGYAINGVNTYAKKLTDYRDALIAYLEAAGDTTIAKEA